MIIYAILLLGYYTYIERKLSTIDLIIIFPECIEFKAQSGTVLLPVHTCVNVIIPRTVMPRSYLARHKLPEVARLLSKDTHSFNFAADAWTACKSLIAVLSTI